MATILEAVGDYIVANTSGAFTYLVNGAGNLRLGIMPETPDAVICLYESAGSPPTFTMGNGGIAHDYPMVQVVSRGTADDYLSARDPAVILRELLATVTEIDSNGLHIARIEPFGSINTIGVDGKRRMLVSVNFRCTVRR